MRADAVRHKATLIEAASRVFAREGVDVALEAVLREAGLGRGTLYRHFPYREALIVAVLEHDLEAAATFVSTNGASPSFLRDFLRMQAQTQNLFGAPLRAVDQDKIKDLIPELRRQIDDLYDAAIQCAHRNKQMSSSMGATDLMRAVRMVAAGAQPVAPYVSDEIEQALDMVITGIAWSAADTLRAAKMPGPQ
jgi:AcrR family transcriptional regulator